MTTYNDLILDDHYKLRITSKRLKSGNYQVKFFATVQNEKTLYGYLLVEANETLKRVIQKIRERLASLDLGYSASYLDLNADKKSFTQSNFLIFQ